MPLPFRFAINTPLLIYSDPDVVRRRRALKAARRWRHDPGPVLEWFGTGQEVPVTSDLVLALGETLLHRRPADPPVTIYADQEEWPDVVIARLLIYERRAGIRCVWGFNPEQADWHALAWFGHFPRTTWPAHRGWWVPPTHFQAAWR